MESQESLKMPPHAWPLQRPDARAWGIALSSWAAFAIGLTVSWQLWTISLVPLGALAAGVSGWMLGARAGALFSLIAATLLLLPIFPSEPALATTQPENLLLALTFALAGGFTGRWRDTGALLRAEVMERRRAEAALQLTAAQEVAMLAAMPDLLFRVSSDGIFLDVRTPDESLLMAPPEDFLGLRVEQVLPEEIAAKVNTAIAQIRASGSSPPYEYSLELEGTRRTFEARGVQVVGHDELLFIIRDVTESRRAEAERQRLAAVVESSNQLVAITDCAGRLEFLNDAGRRLLGLDHGEEIAGRSLEEFVREEARPLLAGILGRRVSEDAEERELPFVNQSTGAAWRGLARPLVLRDQGAGPRLALLAEDLTERLAVEAGLARADRMASVGLLAAGVAHEINNPLTYVLFNLDEICSALARGPLDEAEREDLVELAGDAADGARRVRDIVKDLKTFSNQEDPNPRRVELTEALDTALNLCWNELKFQARVERDYADAPPVRALRSQLAQVFLNLLLNAAQAIEAKRHEDGGRAAGEVITVRAWREGDEAVVSIRDTGVGISPHDLPRIFDPFFTTRPVGSGSGLGLSICHNMVSAMGGRVAVQSAPGEGACFTLRLPVDPSASPVEVTDAGLGAGGRSGRLLIVDDEERAGQALARALSGHHTVERVTSGEQAQRRLESQRYDLVLCDLMMPGISGMALHGWLERRDPEAAGRMIFMSGGAFTPTAVAFLASIDNPRLEKPVDIARLHGVIQQQLTLD